MARWLSWLERRPVTAEVVGSNPIRVAVIISQMITCWKQLTIIYGVLAQLGEHLPYKQRVTGSSPVGPIERMICRKAHIIRIWMDSRVAKGDRL